MSRLRKIARFSTIMKVATICCLALLVLTYLSPFVHPETLWFIPFLGLIYPITIIITIVFLIYWSILRSKWALIVLAGILLGGKLHFRTLAITFSEHNPEPADNTWKFMSYNVRLFDFYNKSEEERNRNRSGIIDYVREVDPDVVCFQEFYHQDKPSNFSTKDTLIQLLGFSDYHERYSHKMSGRQNYGICMLSKYPIIAKGDVMFESSGNSDNYCIFADIVKGKDTLRVYNVHLQSIHLQKDDYAIFDDDGNQQSGEQKSSLRMLVRKLRIAYPSRAEQAIRVTEHMESSPYPVVVMGDFNDTPMSYVYNRFDGKMTDAFRESASGIGVTYAGKVPAGRIDYIFHTEDLRARGFRVQKKVFSDHLAVSCEIWKVRPGK